MKEFAHDTIVIDKAAWKFMWNFERNAHGFNPLTDDQLERVWSRIPCKNGGANPNTHPIRENEIRVDRDAFNLKWATVKETITANGFTYREDGFVQSGVYM